MAFSLTWRPLCMAPWLVAARNLEAGAGSAIMARLSSSHTRRVTESEVSGNGRVREESNNGVKKASAIAGVKDRGIALLRDPKINKVSSTKLYSGATI